MASKPQPHIPGSGPTRSRRWDSIARRVLSERHLPPAARKGPPASPQASEPEVPSVSEEHRPLLSPEHQAVGFTLQISRSRWPEKP